MPDFGRWTSNGGDPSLNEINRTDRFLDALATEQPVYATDSGEAELIGLLSGWRDEIRQKPLSVPVTPRDAVIALDAAQRTRRSRRTLAIVGSTAAAVLCLGGFASVVAGAGPGDTLYGLRTMIFGEPAAPRDDAVMLASQQLAEVQQLVDQGQWDAAQQKLETLTTTVATVGDDVQKQELVSQWQELTVKVEAKDAAATLPPDVPPPTFPEVVVLETPTSSEATTSPETSTSPSEATTSPSETTTPSETSTTPPSETSPSSPTTSPTSPSSGTTGTSTSASTAVQAPPPSTLPTTVPPTSVPNTPTPEQESPASSPSTTLPPSTSTTVALTTRTQPAPSSTVSEAAEDAPTAVQAPPATADAPSATVEAPTVQRQAPQTQRQAPATTIVVPEPEPESGGSGGEGS